MPLVDPYNYTSIDIFRNCAIMMHTGLLKVVSKIRIPPFDADEDDDPGEDDDSPSDGFTPLWERRSAPGAVRKTRAVRSKYIERIDEGGAHEHRLLFSIQPDKDTLQMMIPKEMIDKYGEERGLNIVCVPKKDARCRLPIAHLDWYENSPDMKGSYFIEKEMPADVHVPPHWEHFRRLGAY